MHTNDLYDYGFKKVWNDVFIAHREGYYTSVTDYHEHDFYEINLILSGNVKILTNTVASILVSTPAEMLGGGGILWLKIRRMANDSSSRL